MSQQKPPQPYDPQQPREPKEEPEKQEPEKTDEPQPEDEPAQHKLTGPAAEIFDYFWSQVQQ